MYFRFAVALVLVVAISLIGTTLEKRNLELKRVVSRQHYRLEILREQQATLHVAAEQWGAPVRLIDELDPQLLAPAQPELRARPSHIADRHKRQTPPARNRKSP